MTANEVSEAEMIAWLTTARSRVPRPDDIEMVDKLLAHLRKPAPTVERGVGDAQVIMDSVSMLESAATLLPEHEIGLKCQAHLLRKLHAALSPASSAFGSCPECPLGLGAPCNEQCEASSAEAKCQRIESAKHQLRCVVNSEAGRKAMGEFWVDDAAMFLNDIGQPSCPDCTAPALSADLRPHAKWLRQCAEEIRAEGHAGWGNTCEQAADAIERALARGGGKV